MSGNLCYQIEHHLYPDLPSNRCAQIAERVQAVCAKYDLPYTTGPLARQYLLVLRTIVKLALPDRFLAASSHDAPETASEEKFRGIVGNDRVEQASGTLLRVDVGWPPRSATATKGAQPTTHLGAPASRCECSMNGHRPSDVAESRAEDFLSQALQDGCDRDRNESSDNPEQRAADQGGH